MARSHTSFTRRPASSRSALGASFEDTTRAHLVAQSLSSPSNDASGSWFLSASERFVSSPFVVDSPKSDLYFAQNASASRPLAFMACSQISLTRRPASSRSALGASLNDDSRAYLVAHSRTSASTEGFATSVFFVPSLVSR